MKLTKLEFIDRFSPEEFINLIAASKSSVAIESWLLRFNSTSADGEGRAIDLTDTRTVAGIQAMELFGLIAKGRAAEILAMPTIIITDKAKATFDGLTVGDLVNGLEPFNYIASCEITEIIQSEDSTIVFILGDFGAFDRKYLEKVK